MVSEVGEDAGDGPEGTMGLMRSDQVAMLFCQPWPRRLAETATFDYARAARGEPEVLSFLKGRIGLGVIAIFVPLFGLWATFRLANSRLENNASGNAATDRNGRGSTSAATVFIRGAQPVILKNDFRLRTDKRCTRNV